MKELAVVKVVLMDKGICTKIEGEAPAVVAAIGKILAQSYELLDGIDKDMFKRLCASIVVDDTETIEDMRDNFHVQVTKALRRRDEQFKGGF